MQKFYGFDSTIGVGRNFGFKAGEIIVLPPLEKPVITSINEGVDMAGLRIEFAQFGDFDSFSIYRSDTPMNVSSLPTPIATGLATMYYVDDTVVEGASYYYRVAVLRGGETVLSDESFVVVSGESVDPSSHKWWRVSNIKIDPASPSNWKRGSVAELRFNTISGIVSNIPAKGMSAHQSASSNAASAAFDGNPSTFAYSSNAPGDTLENWWIGYQFEQGEIVTSVSIQNPDWTSSTQKQAWQTADIDVSSDGVIWTKYGTISPMMTDSDKSPVTVTISPI